MMGLLHLWGVSGHKLGMVGLQSRFRRTPAFPPQQQGAPEAQFVALLSVIQRHAHDVWNHVQGIALSFASGNRSF